MNFSGARGRFPIDISIHFDKHSIQIYGQQTDLKVLNIFSIKTYQIFPAGWLEHGRYPRGPRDRRMLGWFLVGSPISIGFELDLGRFTSDQLQTDGRLVRHFRIRFNQFEVDFFPVSRIRPTTNLQAVGLQSNIRT